jgi:scyllo-inositol 2-dehydrogenase (NAD+)
MAVKLRSAVIGCGRMGAFTSAAVEKFAPRCWFPLSHVQAIQLHPQLLLTALCDTDMTSLQLAVQTYGISNSYTDFRFLIDEMKPELIGVATRTLGRAEIIRYAADSGVRALHVEKPLCNSMRELLSLTETFAKPGLFCTYGAIRRFFTMYQLARDLAHSGDYGELQEIRVNAGRGNLYWAHPHSVDLILFAAGDRAVQSVQARLSNLEQGQSSLDIISDPFIDSASIYFDDGLAGHITCGLGHSLVFSCGDAQVSVDNDGQNISILARDGESPYFRSDVYQKQYDSPRDEGTFAPIAHLVRCLGGDPIEQAVNADLKSHILLGQRILFAMVQSHVEQSRLVRPQDVDPGFNILGKTGDKFA